jgi:uncharacterized phiE125 gp8 family phage protein
MSLKLITAPTTLPVTVAEAKLHCRVDTSADDTLIEAYIKAAVDKCEHYTGRALMAQTWRLTLDEFPEAFELTRIPVASITSVKYFNSAGTETTMSSGDYALDNASDFNSAYVVPAYGGAWPTARVQTNAVQVNFVAGYADAASVPGALKAWILLAVAGMYEYREAYTERELKLGYADTLLYRYKVY